MRLNPGFTFEDFTSWRAALPIWSPLKGPGQATVWRRFGVARTISRMGFRLQKVAPPMTRDRYLTMSGIDVTHHHSQVHWVFEQPSPHGPRHTIGVGDGGNELGMGALPWDLIKDTIPLGGRIQCRIPTDSVVVAGVSNWGRALWPGASWPSTMPVMGTCSTPKRIRHPSRHGPSRKPDRRSHFGIHHHGGWASLGHSRLGAG